ncbi:uncharacterized protein LOC124366375 [Homalodisca vitripennis]|uniref:uncharacterized protein LOC124366375 n=1 Tax=Homalodisca vitripennis TaxID=197043 RepID=UPI001EECE0BF|nr:uncharacterized protein LOC124366375 [Homalodisca vitripennis]
MVYDGNPVSDPQEVCEAFVTFFSSVFSHTTEQVRNYQFSSPFTFNGLLFAEDEVFKAMGGLDGSKGCGPDMIPPRVLKYCRVLLCGPLTAMFNKSISTGTFLDVLKVGYVIPIHKSGHQENVANYRPIVIQPALAKLFEKLK